MKLVTFVKAGEERLGLFAGETVIDPLLAGGSPAVFGSALAFIRSGLAGLDAAKAMLVHPPREATIALRDMTSHRTNPSRDYPMQRQQLPRPQCRKGQHADQR